MKLNKKQQRCYDALNRPEYKPEWAAVFLEVCEQYLTDENVCGIDDKHLMYVRQIRNTITPAFSAALRS